MFKNFAGKKIVIGVCGSVAAPKAVNLASLLIKSGAEVKICFTASARKFVKEEDFAKIKGVEFAQEKFEIDDYSHLEFGKNADALLVYPATANTIARLASGLAENMLEISFLLNEKRAFVCPAMNTAMFNSLVVAENLEKLSRRGVTILGPDEGLLACGDYGRGRLLEPDFAFNKLLEQINGENCFPQKKKVLITAGATREYLDDVRYLSNKASGNLGDIFADFLEKKGYKVYLFSSSSNLKNTHNLEVITYESVAELLFKIENFIAEVDLIIGTAAISDFTFRKNPRKIEKEQIFRFFSDQKIEITPDVLHYCFLNKRTDAKIVGFALQSFFDEKVIWQKALKKGCDFMIGNLAEDLGSNLINPFIFNTKNRVIEKWGKMSKIDFVNRLVAFLKEQNML